MAVDEQLENFCCSKIAHFFHFVSKLKKRFYKISSVRTKFEPQKMSDVKVNEISLLDEPFEIVGGDGLFLMEGG